MKYIFFIVILLKANTFFAQKNNCHLTINLSNKDSFQIFYIQEGKEFIYEDTIGLDSNTLNYFVDEPKRAYGYINNDLDNLLIFYLHQGEFSLNIDVDKRLFSFQNSPLNDEKRNLIRKEDSLRFIYHIPTPGILRNLIIAGINKDSLQKIYDVYDSQRNKVYFNYFIRQKIQSFLALEFIKSHLNNHSDKYLTTKKLKCLFNKLPDALKEYPTYKECKALFKQKKPDKETPKPLWNGK